MDKTNENEMETGVAQRRPKELTSNYHSTGLH